MDPLPHMRSGIHELSYEFRDFLFSSHNPVVTFAQDVCIQIQQNLQRVQIILPLREQIGVKGAMDILSKHDLIPLRFRHIDHGAGRMTRGMEGQYLSPTQWNLLLRARNFYIDEKRFHGGSIPGSRRHMGIPSFKKGRIQLVGYGFETKYFFQSLDPAGMIKMTVGNQQILDGFRGDSTLSNVIQNSVLTVAATGIDQGRMAIKTDQVNGRILRGAVFSSTYLVNFVRYLHLYSLLHLLIFANG